MKNLRYSREPTFESLKHSERIADSKTHKLADLVESYSESKHKTLHSKHYRLDEKFVDTAENQPLKIRSVMTFEALPHLEDPGELDLTFKGWFSAVSTNFSSSL